VSLRAGGGGLWGRSRSVRWREALCEFEVTESDEKSESGHGPICGRRCERGWTQPMGRRDADEQQTAARWLEGDVVVDVQQRLVLRLPLAVVRIGEFCWLVEFAGDELMMASKLALDAKSRQAI
jgi:hypothetical protein